jgi:CMP-2-keto-3-deoxyoctulosonic acid synthetase
MSRAPVPNSKKKKFNVCHKQICVYSFPHKILCKYFGLNKVKTKNEKIEDIEILRLIDNDENVNMLELNDNLISVDTKKDFKKAKNLFSDNYF